ncbi:MAG: TetR/AcrR family transcriptional regulator [Acidobacteria bacterium]|nr:TetR/AcrR family transcriptional regulator [Acidobacteriota bacterium]
MNAEPEPRSDVKQRLVEAATLLFAQHGFDGVGIREIAAAADANSAMVAYHFGSKEGLYRAVLRAGFEKGCAKDLPPPPQADAPEAKMAALAGLRAHIETMASDLKLGEHTSGLDEAFMGILMRELGRVDSPYLPELDREFMAGKFEQLAACLRILRPGLTEDQVMYLCGTVSGPLLLYRFIPGVIRLRTGGKPFPEDREALCAFLYDHTLRALGVSPADAGA